MNKKGFTLIELLAVIVILAIIALIAVPIVLGIIDDSKESAMLRSAEFYLDGVENAVMRENMNSGGNFKPSDCTISNGNMTCGSTNVEVEVDGEVPSTGSITFENGKITQVTLNYESGTIVMDDDRKLVYSESKKIENSFEKGTLAYDILTNNGGTGATSEIHTKLEHRIARTGNHYISPSSNYYYGTEYTFNEETKQYTLSGTLTQATLTECRNGTKKCGKYTLSGVSSTHSTAWLYEVLDFQSSGNNVTANTVQYINDFYLATTANEAGLYKTQDDLGDTYYFRGAPTNNYVEFGTYAEDTTLTIYDYNEWSEKTIEVKAGTPMYWRIVRINGDGTIRLVYDGVEKIANGVAHTATIAHTAYNTDYNNAKYVGYTYDDGSGNQVDSTIKGVVDAWYDKHLEPTYGSYIADGIFCNDRNEAGIDQYGRLYYEVYDRLGTNKIPSVKCTNKADRYTMDDTINGNGLLSNPVGLLTADEVAFAGGVLGADNSSYYLYAGMSLDWTYSPDIFEENEFDDNRAYVWYVFDCGVLSNTDILSYGNVGNENLNVRPVINLKADVEFTGNGTIDDPYVILTD